MEENKTQSNKSQEELIEETVQLLNHNGTFRYQLLAMIQSFIKETLQWQDNMLMSLEGMSMELAKLGNISKTSKKK